jgi:hypothetical protein
MRLKPARREPIGVMDSFTSELHAAGAFSCRRAPNKVIVFHLPRAGARLVAGAALSKMNAEHGVHLVPKGHGGLTVASERLSAITGASQGGRRHHSPPLCGRHRGWPSGHRAPPAAGSSAQAGCLSFCASMS